MNDYQQQWELLNKEYRKQYKQQYYLKNKAKIKLKHAEWKKNNPEQRKLLDRKSHLKSTFNITLDQYNALVTKQNNLCAMCGKPLDLTLNNPVDHDHKCCYGKKSCGKCVRGILHDECNRYISLLEKKPELLEAALKYIAH